MLRFLLIVATALQLFEQCSGYLCLAGTCTVNCYDGVSHCDCPAQCLNDFFGGCNANYKCSNANDGGGTVTVLYIVKTGYPTSTSTSYTRTLTTYYSTSTYIYVSTQQNVNAATVTVVNTKMSTVQVTTSLPQVTITRRALLQAQDDVDTGASSLTVLSTMQELKGRRFVKRDTTKYITTTDPNNHCGQPSFNPCITTKYLDYTYSVVAATTITSIYYSNIASVAYATINTNAYATATVTVGGGTVTVSRSQSSSSTTSSITGSDVIVTNMKTATVVATATAAAVSSGNTDVVVTNTHSAVATATASSGCEATPGWNKYGMVIGLCAGLIGLL